jgi:3-phosphoshikimate 1-carboxyvinyltransferase
MRFLTAYCAQLDGTTVILDGVERMRHRPIGQLVDALRELGAQIDYLGEEGYPPLRIKGCILDKQRLVTINNPQSTQFVSALLLIGANVHTDSTSPYITLTRILIENYLQRSDLQGIDARSTAQRSAVSAANELERDWSSAAFWYEYVALHGGEITLPGLYRDSLQGDKVVADIFTRLGVQTTYTAEGITIVSTGVADLQRSDLQGIDVRSTAQRSAEEILLQDFSACPDLYPAVALTCERLGIELHATGTDSLPLKESDRLRAVREHRTDHDHRMAMALLIAGYEVDDTICISKSYPQFIEQWNNVIRSHA